jgi:hypothetical protein
MSMRHGTGYGEEIAEVGRHEALGDAFDSGVVLVCGQGCSSMSTWAWAGASSRGDVHPCRSGGTVYCVIKLLRQDREIRSG